MKWVVQTRDASGTVMTSKMFTASIEARDQALSLLEAGAVVSMEIVCEVPKLWRVYILDALGNECVGWHNVTKEDAERYALQWLRGGSAVRMGEVK